MYCPKCGNILSDDDLICRRCGAEIEISPRPVETIAQDDSDYSAHINMQKKRVIQISGIILVAVILFGLILSSAPDVIVGNWVSSEQYDEVFIFYKDGSAILSSHGRYIHGTWEKISKANLYTISFTEDNYAQSAVFEIQKIDGTYTFILDSRKGRGMSLVLF